MTAPLVAVNAAYYFAYGSNMSKKRLEDRVLDVSVVGNAVLLDYALQFNKISKEGGKANVAPQRGSSVWGVVYELTEEQLEKLDEFEGAPKHYERRDVPVQLNNLSIRVYIYIATQEFTSDEELAPTEEYLGFILTGAKENNISTQLLESIKTQAK